MSYLNYIAAREEHYNDEATYADYTHEAYASTAIDPLYEAYCDYCSELKEGEKAMSMEEFKNQ